MKTQVKTDKHNLIHLFLIAVCKFLLLILWIFALYIVMDLSFSVYNSASFILYTSKL